MDISASREAELLRNYTPYIGAIVSECMKKWRINPCHRDDMMQEGRLAFLSNLRSGRLQKEGDRLVCGKKIYNSIYSWVVQVFPISRIPRNNFKFEAGNYSFVSIDKLCGVQSTFRTDEIVLSNIQVDCFVEGLTPMQRKIVMCMENGLSPMEIRRALSISTEQLKWGKKRIQEKASSFFGA